jgi:hypothetical protein
MRNGDTYRLIEKLSRGGTRKRLTVKQMKWIQDVAGRESHLENSEAFPGSREIVARGEGSDGSYGEAVIHVSPNGVGQLFRL